MHLTQLSRAPFICASCVRRSASLATRLVGCNGSIYPSRSLNTPRSRPSIATPPSATRPILPSSHNAYSTTTASRRRLRVAIIGSGPAGFYTAHRLMNKVQDVTIDMYEQLPVPYGLVRFGVAPDHPEVKNCQDTFEEVAQSRHFNYIGNVRVGTDIALSKLKPHYDAMLFSYGASEDRKLGIPGEDLPGVYSAREFVGWYNGLPQFEHLKPDLRSGSQAVIVGQGNVALDVARILLADWEALQSTDITEEAIHTLRQSKIKSVRIVGRRGPLQAAFTVKEARELMNIHGLAFEPIDPSFYPTETKKLPRVQKRIADVLLKGTSANIDTAPRSWALDFLKAPKSMNAKDGRLSSLTLITQRFAPETDPFGKSARVIPTDEETTVEASIAFRSVGYKSTALPGLADLGVPFDDRLGIIPNDVHGRIISPSTGPGDLTAGHIHGLYCAGWVKRGPTGVIASTMQDAFMSADIIAQDWENNVPFLNDEQGESKSTGLGWDGVKEEVMGKGVRPLSWADWKIIDEAERARGKKKARAREKYTSVNEMLKVLY